LVQADQTSFGSALPLVLRNPRLGICLGLEAKNRLTDAIGAHDRYMKARVVNLRDNCVSGHAKEVAPTGKRNALTGIVADQGKREYRRDRI
jgi:hypothetical protein